MSAHDLTMRTVRFRENGEPENVLAMETVPVPLPGANRIRIAVDACGLAPADWALCRGLFPGTLPRGIGIDVSGRVDAVGEGVTDVSVGDLVLGSADWAGCETAGASDFAIMDRWTPVPAGLDMTQAGAMTMAVDTAFHYLNWLGVTAGKTVVINGAGTTIGYAAVQMARMQGAEVIATAGETYAGRLRELGAVVTRYGEGVAERILAISGGPVDLVLDTAAPSGALPALIKAAGGIADHVMTIADFENAKALGVRYTWGEAAADREDVLPRFAALAAKGDFVIPVAQTFPLDEWQTAMQLSLSGHARGKLLLLPVR